MKLEIRKGELTLTEQNVRELLAAIEKAKKETEFTTEPMPQYDMSTKDYISEVRKRGKILVSSPYANLDFWIELDMPDSSERESIGYRLSN